jgi:hypothetical protein
MACAMRTAWLRFVQVQHNLVFGRRGSCRFAGTLTAGSTATQIPAADEPPIWLYAALPELATAVAI